MCNSTYIVFKSRRCLSPNRSKSLSVLNSTFGKFSSMGRRSSNKSLLLTCFYIYIYIYKDLTKQNNNTFHYGYEYESSFWPTNEWSFCFHSALRQCNRETIPARVINLTNIPINLWVIQWVIISIILENKLERKYLIGELSCRPNVRSRSKTRLF
jgi:hypothetical protein